MERARQCKWLFALPLLAFVVFAEDRERQRVGLERAPAADHGGPGDAVAHREFMVELGEQTLTFVAGHELQQADGVVAVGRIKIRVFVVTAAEVGDERSHRQTRRRL